MENIWNKIFRDELGTNRKTAVALLEYYDAKKITRRQGESNEELSSSVGS